MSGSGKGVSSAVTISNAITNLYVSMFGQHQRLEPLYLEKKMMWKWEMTCLLSVCDYIVELIPPIQQLQNGASMEICTWRFLIPHFLPVVTAQLMWHLETETTHLGMFCIVVTNIPSQKVLVIGREQDGIRVHLVSLQVRDD